MANLKRDKIRWTLFLYDLLVMLADAVLVFVVLAGNEHVDLKNCLENVFLFSACVFGSRFVFKTYSLIWRYGGIQSYVRLMVADFVGMVLFRFLEMSLPIANLTAVRTVAFISINLLLSMALRMIYRYAYKCGNYDTPRGRFLLWGLRTFCGIKSLKVVSKRINVAIIGAGSIGVSLAEDMLNSKDSPYEPRVFIDDKPYKIGRQIHGIKVVGEDNDLGAVFSDFGINQVIFAVPKMEREKQERMYLQFKKLGYKSLTYDALSFESANGKIHLKEFEIEDLLFRKPIIVIDEKTKAYYKDRTILITGGGGSIGSEICRQLASMDPKKLVILDIYENCAYDIQQELMIKYNGLLDLEVEIASITNYKAMERVFQKYKPEIVINAAAHKHVPLMEHNCIEAIENNVFGCKNIIELCEKYEAKRFMMVSTDKAVNPTNVMGATKRMCEIMAQSASTKGKVTYSATRFGNVLGSAGSVIPLFKRQIASGGPVTITDKRIIRYFMTIPEASQLVLASGAMAKNGELFVLDMGNPVKILDLAQNMIELSGAHNIEIIETGLRPGEKLYEELLVKTEELDKTENSLIFIERDQPLEPERVKEKLEALKSACESGDDDLAREALRCAVPTFKRPEEVNREVGKGEQN